MARRGTKWPAVAYVLGLLLVVGCTRPPNSMLDLADQLEDEAESLRWTGRSDSNLSHRIEHGLPWVLIFIPRKGFDDEGAARAGVPEKLRRDVLRRSKAWNGAALVAYATSRETTMTRLADSLDVREQIALRGDPGNVEFVIGLVKSNDQIWVSSVNPRAEEPK